MFLYRYLSIFLSIYMLIRFLLFSFGIIAGKIFQKKSINIFLDICIDDDNSQKFSSYNTMDAEMHSECLPKCKQMQKILKQMIEKYLWEKKEFNRDFFVHFYFVKH